MEEDYAYVLWTVTLLTALLHHVRPPPCAVFQKGSKDEQSYHQEKAQPQRGNVLGMRYHLKCDARGQLTSSNTISFLQQIFTGIPVS